MMKIKFIYCFTLIAILFLGSCKKDRNTPDTVAISTFKITNTNWIVHDARVYLFNLDNGQKEYYDHFDNIKAVSNFDVINGSALPLDTLKKDITKWHFDDNGIFTLNDSTTYGYWLYNGTYTITGLENASARPIVIRGYGADHFSAELYEAYQSDGTFNYMYYSVVTFLKQGASCNNCIPLPDPDYLYQGTIPPSPTMVNDLIGTDWVITRYDQGLTPFYPNDTLSFTDFNTYTINGGIPKNYSYSGIVGNNMKSLILYDCTTLGGNFSGELLNTFVNDWAFNNATFSAILGTPTTVKVWGVRIN